MIPSQTGTVHFSSCMAKIKPGAKKSTPGITLCIQPPARVKRAQNTMEDGLIGA